MTDITDDALQKLDFEYWTDTDNFDIDLDTFAIDDVDNFNDNAVRAYATLLMVKSDNDDEELASKASVNRYLQDLKWFDRWLDTNDIRALEMDNQQAHKVGITLSNTFNGSTPKNRWRIINKMFGFLNAIDAIDSSPTKVFDKDIKGHFSITETTKQSQELGEDETYKVTQEDVRLMEEHAPYPRIRNQTLIRLLWQTGLRVGEVTALEIDAHLDERAHEITVPRHAAKNGEKRIVAYQDSLDPLLQKWLYDGYRDRFSVAEDSPYLFVSRRSEQLSSDAVQDAVVDAATNAGLNRELYSDAQDGSRKKITPHNLRHGYGNYMVDETEANIYAVSRLMGHKSVAVTERKYLESKPDAGTDAGHAYGPD